MVNGACSPKDICTAVLPLLLNMLRGSVPVQEEENDRRASGGANEDKLLKDTAI